eukprot:TRINITY_DN4631_c0_g1_i1.p2 TRINITY_DN4631_c0_g1~~TRINITY_DN4631_c0_g1_i1.p2  ORF type:complete len:115 (+),score=1.91 TRINITY_DN4631_c0_g1_i1:127-471(+)
MRGIMNQGCITGKLSQDTIFLVHIFFAGLTTKGNLLRISARSASIAVGSVVLMTIEGAHPMPQLCCPSNQFQPSTNNLWIPSFSSNVRLATFSRFIKTFLGVVFEIVPHFVPDC